MNPSQYELKCLASAHNIKMSFDYQGQRSIHECKAIDGNKEITFSSRNLAKQHILNRGR
ncbi:hypothetical protein JQC92_02505 [Shewanella sp. 202IG2-18]|uniref:hypothetical protein n=1 Tax=Parashewanella hymeniacidonis TaxID=2807618 RepID=UPI001960F938|nr:hypothetical protein [Parashewanella hymeniacidonis]MBM7070913.1 hypothetical protein [Parashewanella hymeniacidonis]